MSSEMRESKFTNEDLETISRTWNSNKYTEHTAMLLASELLRARALLARTEAGADGVIYQMMATDEDVDEDGNVRPDDPRLWMDHSREEYERLKDHPSVRSRIVYTRPQDASGDAVAELIAAADVLNTGAKHGLSTYPEDWKRLDSALIAMQAKEAK